MFLLFCNLLIQLSGKHWDLNNFMYSGFCAESEGVSIPGGWLYTEVSGNANVVGMRWGCWTSTFMLISVFVLDIYQTRKYKTQTT